MKVLNNYRGSKNFDRAERERLAIEEKRRKKAAQRAAQQAANLEEDEAIASFAELLAIAEKMGKITQPYSYSGITGYYIDEWDINNNRPAAMGGGFYAGMTGGKFVASKRMSEKMFKMVVAAHTRMNKNGKAAPTSENEEMDRIMSWLESRNSFVKKYKTATVNNR